MALVDASERALWVDVSVGEADAEDVLPDDWLASDLPVDWGLGLQLALKKCKEKNDAK